MRFITSRITLTVIVGISFAIVGATIIYAATTVVLATGTIAHSNVIGGPASVTFRTISFAPGEVGAWHYHPGPLFNVVKEGTVTLEDGCGGEESYSAGTGFEEGYRIHRPKNLGLVPTFAYQAFVIPFGDPTTINVPGQMCGPPRRADVCRHGQWANYNFPVSFGNQGQCISWVNNN